jgi:hypothetical protein
MKFDLFVEQLLTEMPHVSFSSSGSVLNIDLKMEKYQNDYSGFLNYVKNILSKINSDEVKQDFKKELEQNKQFLLYLNKIFKKDFESFLMDVNF